MMDKDLGIKNRRKGKRHDLIPKSINTGTKKSDDSDQDPTFTRPPRTPSINSNPLSEVVNNRATTVPSPASVDDSSEQRVGVDSHIMECRC